MPWHHALQQHIAPGHGGRHHQRAGLNAIGHDTVVQRAQFRDALHPDGAGAGTLDPGAHALERLRQVHDLRLTGGIFQHGLSLGQGSRHQQILRAAHRWQIQVDARADQLLGPGVEVSLFQIDFGAHRFQPLGMQIDGPGADGASARKRDPGASETRQQGAQHQYRGAHGAHHIVGRLEVVNGAGIRLQDIFFPGDTHTQGAQQLLHRIDVAQAGHIGKTVFSGRQQRRADQRQRRVLGTADMHRATQFLSSMNNDLVHSITLLLWEKAVFSMLFCRKATASLHVNVKKTKPERQGASSGPEHPSGPAPAYHPGNACIVTPLEGLEKTGVPKEPFHRIRLSLPHLHQKPSTGFQRTRRVPDDDAQGIQAVGASGKRKMRFVIPHLRHQLRHVAIRHIGRIGNHQIETARLRQRLRKILPCKSYPFRHAIVSGIGLGKFQGLRADITGANLRLGQLMRKGYRHNAASGAQIQNTAGIFTPFERLLNQNFRIRTGNQHRRRHRERQRPEFRFPQNILERFARCPPRHQLPDPAQLLLLQRAIVVEVKTHPVQMQHRTHQQFRIKPRTVDATPFKVAGRPPQHVEYSPNFSHGFRLPAGRAPLPDSG